MPKSTVSMFQLFRLIRDAESTYKAERTLLIALALRSDPAKSFVCWPTYGRLRRDTGLCLNTLRSATVKLEKQKLIRRTFHSDRANKWWMNVPLLMEQAAAVKARDEAKKAEDDEESPSCACVVDADAPDDATHGDQDNDATWMSGGARLAPPRSSCPRASLK